MFFRFAYHFLPVLFACFLCAGSAAAQSSTVVVHNNTGATLTVFLQYESSSKRAGESVIIPPESVGTLSGYSGKRILWAVAEKMNPERTFTRNMVLSVGVTNVVQIFAGDFGLSAMFDAPDGTAATGATALSEDPEGPEPSMAELRSIEAIGVEDLLWRGNECRNNTLDPLFYKVKFVNTCPEGFITRGREPPGGSEFRWCAYCGSQYQSSLNAYGCCVPK